MKPQMEKLFLPAIKNEIVDIADLSDSLTRRLRLIFKNGFGISIIRGEYSYGGNQGLYEIAPLDREGNLDGTILDIEGDDVEGHLSEAEVIEKIKIIANKRG